MIHRAASIGFARSAAAYERGRPGYPEDALAWLAQRLGLAPGRVVVDLAAGTGKLTRGLLLTGSQVIAVEPVAQMRAAIGSGARVLEGAAEAIPLPDASADAVTVAQAFHWFDAAGALAEVHRVLRAGGALALVWNRRMLEDPVNAAIEAIVAPHRGDTPSHRAHRWRSALKHTRRFGPIQERTFTHTQTLGVDALVDRVASISFVAALPASAREGVLAQVRPLAPEGWVTLRYRTEVQVTDRR